MGLLSGQKHSDGDNKDGVRAPSKIILSKLNNIQLARARIQRLPLGPDDKFLLFDEAIFGFSGRSSAKRLSM